MHQADLVEARVKGLMAEPIDVFNLAHYPVEYTRVFAEGQWVHDRSVYIGPRVR